jgi:UDP-N-acetylglucosamine--N-acetylmuramyl-(pentapeptide) pyrophosphoryl-undecaprenol N-acetylglucosamine transferase
MVKTFATDEIRRGIQIIWQTGTSYKPEIPAEIGHLIRTMPFIDDMDSAYGSADLVISRSGATTIAELGIVGKPAILVPLPTASMNEQMLNGRIAEERGAAIVVPDDEVGERLPRVIRDLLDDPMRLTVMAGSMKKLGREHAAHDVAKLVLQTGGRTVNGDGA